MPWNRARQAKLKQPENKGKKISLCFYVAAIFTAIIIAVSFFLNGEDKKVSKELPRKTKKISRVSAAKKMKPSIRKDITENTNQETNVAKKSISPRKGKHSGRFVDVSKAIFIPRKDPPRRFVNDAEEDIASLLEVIPGEMLIGEINYHKKNRFVDSLKAAIKNPTTVTPDDSPYTVELKNAVQDVISDLSQRMQSGEDVAKIMHQSRAELQDLGIYRMELQNELKSIRKETDITASEYEQFVEAANKMLEKKGAEPLKTPKIIYRQLQLREKRNQK